MMSDCPHIEVTPDEPEIVTDLMQQTQSLKPRPRRTIWNRRPKQKRNLEGRDPCIRIAMRHVKEFLRRKKQHTLPRVESRERISYGIVLCRQNPETHEVEAIIGQRRITYAFAEFVNSRFNRHNYQDINNLLGQMSLDELIVIKSLNFAFIWHFLKTEFTHDDNYRNKEAKFKRNFLAVDGGRRLLSAVNNVQGRNLRPLWEFPKGSRNENEEPTATAMREMEEEAGIEPRCYRLCPQEFRSICFKSRKMRYRLVYFLGIANELLTHNFNRPQFRIGSKLQVYELSMVKWASISEIRWLNLHQSSLIEIAEPLFRLYKRIKKDKRLESDTRAELVLSDNENLIDVSFTDQEVVGQLPTTAPPTVMSRRSRRASAGAKIGTNPSAAER
jgi:8-oxo-dGTP pyrophosphatase MutT (NUDIX family)